jgi:XTP/dITP diphosphohydrolase
MISIGWPEARQRSSICESILRALPDWFAIESSILRYTGEAALLPMLTATQGGEPVGFVTLKSHGREAWEIHVIAVRPEFHRQGIGRRLLAAAELECGRHGVEFLTVKTLSPSSDYAPYERTRGFYEAMGFRPLMEVPELWGPDDPCLIMLKPLDTSLGHRQFTGRKLVIASHNAGKLREIAELLASYSIEAVSAAALGLAEPEETGDTFVANAEIKARAAALASGLPALADDSGLVVAALDGAPGIFSARWAGKDKDFGIAMERVERELKARDAGDRRAHFTAALALCWPDGHCETFEGRVDGSLVWPPRGSHGFGYDPMFVPLRHGLTFGEMEPARKHAMSHRADAFRQLTNACFAR